MLYAEVPMDDRAFFDALVDHGPRRLAGAAFLKKAGVGETAKEVAQKTTKFLKSHGPEIAGALVGAAAITAAQYEASKPGKSGQSAEQRLVEGMRKAHKSSIKNDLADGKEPGFSSDFAGASISSAKPFADLLAKHPGKGAALFAGPIGAKGGWELAKILTRRRT